MKHGEFKFFIDIVYTFIGDMCYVYNAISHVNRLTNIIVHLSIDGGGLLE